MPEFRIIFEKPILTIGPTEYQNDARCHEILDRFMEQFGYTAEEVYQARFTEATVEVEVCSSSMSVCRWCTTVNCGMTHTVRHNLVDGSLSLDGA